METEKSMILPTKNEAPSSKTAFKVSHAGIEATAGGTSAFKAVDKRKRAETRINLAPDISSPNIFTFPWLR